MNQSITTAIEAQIGPRGSATITAAAGNDTRKAARAWLKEKGVPYMTIGRLTIGQLTAAYNDTSDMELSRLMAAPAPTPAPSIPFPGEGEEENAGALLAEAVRRIAEGAAPRSASIDAEQVRAIVREEVANRPAPTIEVRVGDAPARTIARQHRQFPLLLATVAARVPAFLVGPAGTGKTSAAHAVADALGLTYGAMSVGPMTSKADLFGFVDATGAYRDTELVRRATDGGVFLFDELDAGHAGVLTAVNMLLANGQFATPQGMRDRHPDLVPVMALNTYGNGADRQYVGRNQLDAATLDRGAVIAWGLDEGLEAAMIGVAEPSTPVDIGTGGIPTPEQWLSRVRAFRAAVDKLGLRMVVSPRAVMYGHRMAATGIGMDHLTDALLYKGASPDVRTKINANL